MKAVYHATVINLSLVALVMYSLLLVRVLVKIDLPNLVTVILFLSDPVSRLFVVVVVVQLWV